MAGAAAAVPARVGTGATPLTDTDAAALIRSVPPTRCCSGTAGPQPRSRRRRGALCPPRPDITLAVGAREADQAVR
jgi:hypothetical protein